jgi:hypothetical protein
MDGDCLLLASPCTSTEHVEPTDEGGITACALSETVSVSLDGPPVHAKELLILESSVQQDETREQLALTFLELVITRALY